MGRGISIRTILRVLLSDRTISAWMLYTTPRPIEVMRPRSNADWMNGGNVCNGPIVRGARTRQMQETNHNKSPIRRQLREALAQMTEPTRQAKGAAGCALIVASPEFAAA